MDSTKLLEDIRETNLAYLMLAQHLIRKDRAEALYRLGVTEEVADIIAALTPAQLLKLAASHLLMCSFRFSDETVWSLLTSHSKDRAIGAGIHASILMAGQLAEAA